MHRVVLLVIALLVLYIYSYCLVAGTGYALALLHPEWWDSMFSTRAHAALSWMVLIHSVAVLAGSAPFAYLNQRLYGRDGPVIVLAMTVTLLLAFALPSLMRYFGDSPARFKVVWIFDQIKLLAVLPVLVWAFGKLPSNQRLERPGC